MGKIKYWIVAVVIVLVAVGAFLIVTMKDRDDPLNSADVFVYSDGGTLNWFEPAIRFGKVEGKFYSQQLIEEIGQVPVIEKKSYSLTGEKMDKGYRFKAAADGKTLTFDAWFSGKNLIVKEKNNEKVFLPSDKEKLTQYKKEIQEDLDYALYHMEEKEKTRRTAFFTQLKSVYGYLYSAEDGSSQLFLKIDEAYAHGGEVAGSLLTISATGDENKPYQEKKYALNGITDGLMIRLFTKVDGKETKLEGDFIGATTGLKLSFWETDEKLSFHAVTEEEYKKSYEDFKLSATGT